MSKPRAAATKSPVMRNERCEHGDEQATVRSLVYPAVLDYGRFLAGLRQAQSKVRAAFPLPTVTTSYRSASHSAASS